MSEELPELRENKTGEASPENLQREFPAIQREIRELIGEIDERINRGKTWSRDFLIARIKRIIENPCLTMLVWESLPKEREERGSGVKIIPLEIQENPVSLRRTLGELSEARELKEFVNLLGTFCRELGIF